MIGLMSNDGLVTVAEDDDNEEDDAVVGRPPKRDGRSIDRRVVVAVH